jgi:excisionase family DNA binding protein
MGDDPNLMTIAELAAKLQVPQQTLYAWRSRGEGPPGIRVGRHVRYRPDAVDAWLLSREGGGPSAA